jgi:hypothetical protein
MQLEDLNDSAWTIAYYAVVQALKNDPVLSTAIAIGGWRTYTDGDSDDVGPGEDSLPAIETLPFAAGASPLTITSQTAPLGIAIQVACEGADVRDLLNLWGAVHKALFPGDASTMLRTAIVAAFQAAKPPLGAQLASVQLSSPAITPSGTGLQKQFMSASGTITLNMTVSK